MASKPLCDLLPLAFEPTDIGLQAYALPATPQQITKKRMLAIHICQVTHALFQAIIVQILTMYKAITVYENTPVPRFTR